MEWIVGQTGGIVGVGMPTGETIDPLLQQFGQGMAHFGGLSWVIERGGEDSEADWWRKKGEHIFSRKYAYGWPVIWRFHHDALEADLVGYAEGLGLILWSFRPGEYLRRSENLERGEDLPLNGRIYPTLVSTPDWIKRPPFLKNRKHYPFNESTMMSWAQKKPVVTYFIDTGKGAVAAAEFAYFDIERSSTGDWYAEAKPSGTAIFSIVEEFGRTKEGGWYPRAVNSEVTRKGELARRTFLTVEADPDPKALPVLSLPPDKRMLDPWPLYRPEAFRCLRRLEGDNHANRVGLARALCYEGDLVKGERALFEAVSAMEADRRLSPSTFGGIDWEFGFAVYELFWKSDDAQIEAFWEKTPRSSTWKAILARAVLLYQKYRPREKRKLDVILAGFESTFDERERTRAERTTWELYLECLLEEREKAAETKDQKRVSELERLIREVENRLGE